MAHREVTTPPGREVLRQRSRSVLLALIELAGRRGDQMRIHLNGARTTDLMGSAQAFRSRQLRIWGDLGPRRLSNAATVRGRIESGQGDCAGRYCDETRICVYFHIMISEYLLSAVAARFKALSDASRLRLLSLLHEKEQSVSELVQKTGRRQPSVSQALAQLSTAGLVASRREGSRVIYSLSDASVARICDVVCRSVSENAMKQALALAGPARVRKGQRA